MKAFNAVVFVAFLASASAKEDTTFDYGKPNYPAAEPTEAPQHLVIVAAEGLDCDPHFCINAGYCQGYLRCDKKAGKWVREECGENLAWNPLHSNGTYHVHGGNCDVWDNLNNDIAKMYRSDIGCLACFWNALGSCSQKYEYQPANGTHRNVLRLSCAEGLVFSPEKETCQRCQDVKDDNGNACC